MFRPEGRKIISDDGFAVSRDEFGILVYEEADRRYSLSCDRLTKIPSRFLLYAETVARTDSNETLSDDRKARIAKNIQKALEFAGSMTELANAAGARRRLETLTLADLSACRVWRHCAIELPAEATDFSTVANGVKYAEYVEPAPGVAEVGENDACLVLTKFVASSGAVFWGYCSPSDPSGLDYIQPTKIKEPGHVPLWWDWNPGDVELERRFALLGAPASMVFPLHYEAQVLSDGETVAGTIERVETNDGATSAR